MDTVSLWLWLIAGPALLLIAALAIVLYFILGKHFPPAPPDNELKMLD